MSDYGDDYSDADLDFDPWLYIEEDVHPADDLAEHAIASPPPTAYAEEDPDDFDLFSYWYDIEEASDGYDGDAQQTTAETANSGMKRKRAGNVGQRRKRQKTDRGQDTSQRPLSPTPTVLFKSQAARDQQREKNTRFLDETAESYALVLGNKSKRPSITGTSESLQKDHDSSRDPLRADSVNLPLPSETLPIVENVDDENMEEPDTEASIDAGALMAALQNRLADVGGAPQGFDPSVLLQYAMRMMAGTEESDDIAGELAEEMLGRDDDDPTAPGIASWLSNQRGDAEEDDEWEEIEEDEEVETTKPSLAQTPRSPVAPPAHRLPPTPSSTDTNASNPAKEETPVPKRHPRKPTKTSRVVHIEDADPINPLKRKADEDDAEESTSNAKKKRSARSFDAPTAASQARAASTSSKATRTGRMKAR